MYQMLQVTFHGKIIALVYVFYSYGEGGIKHPA